MNGHIHVGMNDGIDYQHCRIWNIVETKLRRLNSVARDRNKLCQLRSDQGVMPVDLLNCRLLVGQACLSDATLQIHMRSLPAYVPPARPDNWPSMTWVRVQTSPPNIFHTAMLQCIARGCKRLISRFCFVMPLHVSLLHGPRCHRQQGHPNQASDSNAAPRCCPRCH